MKLEKLQRRTYNGAAAAEKNLARQIFQSLDTNGDGKVSRCEYEKAVGNSSSFTDNDFFEKLDADCNKTLDFDEVLALYYMEKVSVPRPTSLTTSAATATAEGDTRAMLNLLDQILKQSQITNHQTDEFDLIGVEGAEEGEEHEEVDKCDKPNPTVNAKERTAVSALGAGVSIGNVATTAAIAMAATCRIMYIAFVLNNCFCFKGWCDILVISKGGFIYDVV
ncbi:hypothetical protein SASPL_154906 [Salvia splendens]|uniref:EF-hand domain-containing protein n=1 Tax=Salvia splendens TaxID=180675 RepID=A0A8X8YYW0_SALSN|nr:hypothetical protein SASPL_154906 [Salvia splendens]